MKIIKKENGGALNIALSGRLDTTTAPELDAVVQNLKADIKDIVFDFKGLEYVSSAGLRVLLACQKIMKNRNGTMKIINANAVVRDVFRVTGFANFINIQ